MIRATLLRKIFFWTHLVLGLIFLFPIVWMASTGLLLSFERQIVESNEDSYLSDTHPTNRALLDASERVARTRGNAHGALHGITLRRAAQSSNESPSVFVFEDGATLLLDPNTGNWIGRSTLRESFHTLEHLHRSVGIGMKSIANERYWNLGRTIAGIATVGFVTLMLVGIILWLPAKWNQKSVRAIAFLRRPSDQNHTRARNWNWHHVIGFWSLPILITISVSGLFIAFPAITKTLERLLDGPTALPAAPPEQLDVQPFDPQSPDWNAIVLRCQDQVPAWTHIVARFPSPRNPRLQMVVSEGSGRRPDLIHRLDFNPQNAELVKAAHYSMLNRSGTIRGWTRFLHTGEALGVVGQVLAALGTVSALLLAYTGAALSLHRFRSWRKRIAIAREEL